MVLTLALLAGTLILVLPRKKIIFPIFLFAMLVPEDQILVIGGLHFPILRILVFFGFLRIILARLRDREEIFAGGMNRLDKSVLLLVGFTGINGILLWKAWGEVVFQFGMAYTVIGVYTLLRFLIRDEEDVKRLLRAWALAIAVVSVVMVCEKLTGGNFAYEALGGARSAVLEKVTNRGGTLRATGTFQHPIIAGTFGAISWPLFLGLWLGGEKKDRKYAVLGLTAASLIPFLTGSSTSVVALAAAIFGMCCWFLRRFMRPIRWAIAATLVGLDLVMNGPVWALITRFNLTGSSDADHRYELVNQCILHFGQWALVGTKNFDSWGWSMWDLANQYVSVADTSGLIPLICFLGVLVYAFKFVGNARKAADQEGNRAEELFIWALAVSVFANAVGFFGISYWDQIIVAWYAILAAICAVCLPVRSASEAAETVGTAFPGTARALVPASASRWTAN